MRLRSKKGQVIVEFALIFPLLLILIFGIIEFGLLLYNKAVITNASREGARFGIVAKMPRNTQGEIGSVVAKYCDNNLITFGAKALPVVNATAPNSNFGTDLTVTVGWNFEFLLIPSFLPGISDTVDISAVTVMKYE